MRRATTLALIAGGTLGIAAAAVAGSRARGRGEAIPGLVTGVFNDGMPYVRWGTGPRSLLILAGFVAFAVIVFRTRLERRGV